MLQNSSVLIDKLETSARQCEDFLRNHIVLMEQLKKSPDESQRQNLIQSLEYIYSVWNNACSEYGRLLKEAIEELK